MTMFVAIVVPWKTWSRAEGASPACSVSSRMPWIVPCDGSSGVVGSLWTRIVPALSST
jgi:hypothetical protein